MALRDLQSKKLIVTKGLLFVLLGCVLAVMVVVEEGAWWKRLALLALCVWAYCRAYYFAFYVLEHYVDSSFKYSGLMSAVRYLCAKSPSPKRSTKEPHNSGRSDVC